MSGRPTPEEMSLAQQWFETCFAAGEAAKLPFSFRYGGVEKVEKNDSASLLANWACEWIPGDSGPKVESGTILLTDPDSGLECRCEVTRYLDFPAVEWVIYFKNGGEAETSIIADIQPLDVFFEAAKDCPCRVHHAKGSQCRIDDFAVRETPLKPPSGVDPNLVNWSWRPEEGAQYPVSEFGLTSIGGRSSDGALPFFNLQIGEGGVIGAIGWTGNWTATFARDAEGVRVRAGMQRTHLKLHPGEEIRSPRILFLFWEGERIHGHNMLRQFILAHHTPRPDGELLQAPLSFAVWGKNLAEKQIAKARWFAENDIPIDNFWIDAGWYGDAGFDENAPNIGDWPIHVGNWWPNRAIYPDGLKPVGEFIREQRMRFTLWVEAERVFRDTALAREHPEWLLGPVGDNYLFNLGDPEARAALTDLISSIITEGGVTVYRQDFNMEPEPFWRAADAPDRVGMSEIRHIEGLYAFWDELLTRHPGLIIDNCASGGRRIDLETISRSIPLWRSDYQCWTSFDPIGIQGQTHGLSLWVPLSTGCCNRQDTYMFRSALGPGMVLGTAEISGAAEGFQLPWDAYEPGWFKKMCAEQKEVQKYFYGDFYPLFPFSLTDSVWAAWQFDRPDLGEGMVLTLRRPSSPFAAMTTRLRGLDPDAGYKVWSADGGDAKEVSGAELLNEGMTIEIAQKPGSRLFLYKQVE